MMYYRSLDGPKNVESIAKALGVNFSRLRLLLYSLTAGKSPLWAKTWDQYKVVAPDYDYNLLGGALGVEFVYWLNLSFKGKLYG